MATLPFYWNDLEPEKGKQRYEKDSPKIYRRPTIDLCIEYCEQNGIEPREHALAYDAFFPNWLCNSDVAECKREYERCCKEISECYGNKINTIEVTNEMLWKKGKTALYEEGDFVEAALYHYMLPCNHPGLNQHPDYLYDYYPDQTQKDAIETWNISSENAKKHKLPTLALTEDEKREVTDIKEVTEDNFTIAIFDIMLGRKSIDEYDKAVKAMKDAGYDKVLEINQAAYNRYLKKLNE